MPNDDISPLNIAELRLRILHDSLSLDAAHDLVAEVIACGTAGSQLVTLLVSRYRDGALPVATDSLVRLYEATRSSELLAAMRDRGAFSSVGIEGKCRLFRAGVATLETDLIESLWRGWGDPGNPMRRIIVEALAASGTGEALEVLQVIDYRLAGDLAVQRLKAPPEDLLSNLRRK